MSLFDVLSWNGISFLSLGYLAFLLVAVLVRYLCPKRGRAAALLAVSWLFYCTWNPVCLVFLLVTIGSTYLAGLWLGNAPVMVDAADSIDGATGLECAEGMKRTAGLGRAVTARENAAARKGILAGCLILNLGILFCCKYWTMFLPGILEQTLLPVGISFYTLQALGYVIDCYLGKERAEKSFVAYALFVSFFPGITSGPIERGGNLLPQIHALSGNGRNEEDSWENLRNGILILFWGYFLKLVLADRIAIVVNAVYSDPQSWKGTVVVLAVLLYSIQIYCDFAGYSAIAIGSARVLGFRVMQNFTAPYLTTSIAEFWRNWHISLSTWFRDYLYIPLGGNRKGAVRKHLNLLIVFAVSGLWHGAGATYLVWGLLHGVYQVIGDLKRRALLRMHGKEEQECSPLRKRSGEKMISHREGKGSSMSGTGGEFGRDFSGRVLRTIVVFVLVSFAWIFFRAESFSKAWEIIRCMRGVTLWQLTDGSLIKLGLDTVNWVLLACGILLLLVRDICVRRGISLRAKILRQSLWLRWILYIGVILLILVCGIWGPGYDASTFIYSQF